MFYSFLTVDNRTNTKKTAMCYFISQYFVVWSTDRSPFFSKGVNNNWAQQLLANA